MQEANMNNVRAGGYYTVMVDKTEDGLKMPYTVFAASDFHAARIVRSETGYAATENEVHGPYLRL
jgi:hypothetical protein